MLYQADYSIRRDAAELDSTGYMEIGPGRYSGVHWQQGFLFIWADAFTLAEGILLKHFKTYDHFAMNDVPKAVGLKVIEEWHRVAKLLPTVRSAEAARLLNLRAFFHPDLEDVIQRDNDNIAAMLKELANECDSFYASDDWICVLGI